MSTDAVLPQLLEEWEPVIGLEIHVQLGSVSKAFSSSATTFGEPPNSLTDPLVLGMPGTLPVYNQRAAELAVALGVATSSKIRARSRFARKHYFYPDLPKGYQITQSDEPLCEEGTLDVLMGTQRMAIRLQRIHLEEDAGKSSHHGTVSHVDLNRAGVPLVEVVTAPELHSAEEAAEFMRSLHRLVRWLGISDGDMEKGQMRCDANVSVRRRGEDRLGTRTELKNINSFRFVQNAIDNEIVRQIRLLETGERVLRETRLWDATANASFPMRSKEEANDYRYFPDPDLPPLLIDGPMMARVMQTLPTLPGPRFERYREWGITGDDARTLIGERALSDYFEAAIAALPSVGCNAVAHAKAVGNWLLTTLLGALNRDGKSIAESPFPATALAAIVGLIEGGTISGKIAKDVFDEAYQTGAEPAAIVAAKGLVQISNPAELLPIISRLLVENPKQIEAYRNGNEKMLGYFVGKVMKATDGKANPQVLNDLLRKALVPA
ncbi:MAG TPA: Asp-tRNA(Asn)/Glu-tRNA(Gln) amidotransferase subunit GatB [Kofleriaceae bacterium]|nr:Asp-tRNA(Asn)/Glu-tRNA(Gln) amidotransferase subunit GatB [Kofleriaceae bacterium]